MLLINDLKLLREGECGLIVCPSCGANLKFDARTQRMLCEFCGSDFDPKQFEVEKDAQEQTIAQETEPADDGGFETYDVTVYTCPQCGGELMSVDENTAAAFCSFCGASTILTPRIAKEKRPEFIIPFSITKDDCKEAYRKLVKRALFIPKEYKSEKCIDGFRGIYMPFWSYDVKQSGPVNLKGQTEHRSGDYIITKYYSLTGSIDAKYDGLSYDASSSFSDDISEALMPYDVTKRIAFEPSYMSGFYADIADVGKEVYSREASALAYNYSLSRIKSETQEFRKYTITGDSASDNKPGTAFSSRTMKGHSAMFPVWFMSYRNGDRVTYATVNGQTGKIAADLPIDPKKYLLFSGILAVVIFLILNLFLVLTPKVLLLIASILTIAVFLINASQRGEIKKVETGVDDKGLTFKKGQERLKNKEKGNETKEEKDKAFRKLIKGEESVKMPGLEKAFTIIGAISIVLGLLMYFLLHVVSDMPYYVLCIADAVVFMICFRFTLLNYNRVATRRLPQFDRKGGDDRA